ncbi:MAG: zinc finger domain-containing protein [Candidatus Kariarchaeaceae archaeon]
MSAAKIETDSCYSCNKIVSPTQTGSSKFYCPQCGGMIIRCAECRRLSNTYTCPSCNFEGP